MKSAYHPIWALLLILTASAISQPILAGSVPGNDGSVILRMCKGADKAPDALVTWITAHPDVQSQPAGAVVQKALAERFPCKGGK